MKSKAPAPNTTNYLVSALLALPIAVIVFFVSFGIGWFFIAGGIAYGFDFGTSLPDPQTSADYWIWLFASFLIAALVEVLLTWRFAKWFKKREAEDGKRLN